VTEGAGQKAFIIIVTTGSYGSTVLDGGTGVTIILVDGASARLHTQVCARNL
jgi:hypothetical protein